MNGSGGFTIVETLIVLAMAGFLLGSTMLVFTGQQASQNFRQALQDVDNKLQDVINDTSTGYFDALSRYTCNAGGGSPPTFSVGASGHGQNLECIFIGKTVLFSPTSNPETMEITPVIGNRQFSGREVTSFTEAYPTTVNNVPDLTSVYPMKGNLRIKSASPSRLAGFYGSFAQYSQGTLAASGAQRTQFRTHNLASNTRAGVRSCVENFAGCSGTGVQWVLCFEDSNDTSRTGTITVSAGNTLTTRMEIAAC